MKLKNVVFFLHQVLMTFFRKINALHTYFVAKKNKMEQSKTSGARSSGIYKSRWQFYESLLF